MRRVVAAAALAVLASGASAMAAQTKPGPGLYLRGDADGALPLPAIMRDGGPIALGTSLGRATVGIDSGNTVILGAGVGYRFTPSFGAGATLTYIPSSQLSGLDGSGFDVSAPGEGAPLVGMLSGYIDLAAAAGLGWGGVQPFVIGGIGLARNEFGAGGAPLGGAAHTDLAWGVGAGIGIPLGGRFSVDMTYRYLDLGQMRFGASSSLGAAAPGNGDMHVHAATLGLRLGF